MVGCGAVGVGTVGRGAVGRGGSAAGDESEDSGEADFVAPTVMKSTFGRTIRARTCGIA